MIGKKFRALAVAGALGMVLIPTAAWAAPEGRIQQVESTAGQVTFLFSAAGLAEGQSVDPASIEVTLDGQAVPAQAQAFGQTAAEPAARQVVLALDSSGSMAEDGKMQAAKGAARVYLDTVPEDVTVGLISFADEATVVVAPTADRATVLSAIDDLNASGATALYDAVALSVATLGTEGSRSIVLLSDGEDEGSTATLKEAAKSVKGNSVTLDAVSLGSGAQEKPMAALAKAGNGALVTSTDAGELAATFKTAARTLSNELVVTATVPEQMDAGLAPLVASVQAGDTTVTDAAVAQVEPAAVAVVPAGPSAAERVSPLWTNKVLIAVALAGLFVALLMLSMVVFNTVDPSRRRDGRIERRLGDAGVIAADAPSAPSSLGDSAAIRSAVHFTEKVATGPRTDRLEMLLQAAGTPLRAPEWITVVALIALAFGFIGALFSGFSLMSMLLFGAFGAFIPWMLLRLRASKRRAEFYEQLPDMMQLMAGGLAAGYSLPQALDAVAREAKDPVKREISRALMESRVGVPLEDSLEAVAVRMDSNDFHWVVMAINLNRRVGGNLGDVLRSVGDTLRERERLRRQVKALSAEGRWTAWILGAIPFLFTGYLMLVRPGYLGLLTTNALGWFLIAAGVTGMALGIFVMSKLIKIEV